jgi:hypothetical protein
VVADTHMIWVSGPEEVLQPLIQANALELDEDDDEDDLDENDLDEQKPQLAGD